MTRADSFAVNSCLTMPWKDFCKLLHEAWGQSTSLANWAARELDRRDVVRLPNMKKLPKMPSIPQTRKGRKRLKGLYGLASVQFDFAAGWWKGTAICASSILRAVERKYRRERYKIVWGGERTSARYRYPAPFPVHANCWSAEFRSGVPIITVRIGSHDVELRLRGGPEFGRQLANLRRVVSGEAKQCQLLISRQRSDGGHRRTIEERKPGGGDRVSYRIMVKIVTHQPDRVVTGDRVLTLATDPNSLWVAELDGRQAWVLNADHVKRACDWQAVHASRRQRWAQDAKAERRASRRRRAQFQSSRDRCCEKHARRMKSWCQECAAHLAKFAVRQRVSTVAYMDADKSFMPAFPWAQLKLALANALSGEGIELVASPDAKAESAELEAVC